MSTSTKSPVRESSARRRLVDTAHRLFYSEGIHTVGIDRVIAEAGIAKATFYNHFATKDELVGTYLTEQLDFQREAVARLRESSTDPMETLIAVFEAIGEIGCGPGFRGCPFINAAAEYPDPSHPVRGIVAEYRAWFHRQMLELLTEAGHPDPALTARMLRTYRDGLVISSDLDDTPDTAGIRPTLARLLKP